MKRILLICSLLISVAGFGQATYYWVGGTAGNVTSSTSWNTNLDGSGTPRTATTSDRLIFDGSNIGGSSPATGMVTPLITGSPTIGQLVLRNGAQVTLLRNGTNGTTTFTITGDGNLATDDLLIDATSALTIANTVTSQNLVLQVGTIVAPIFIATGKIYGTVNISGSVTSRLVCMYQRHLSFESGSNANVNLTGASAFPFGSNSATSTQTSEKGIIFQAGANLNYLGGNSPMGNSSGFSALEMTPESNWYHKATNPVSGSGSFFNAKSFGNIFVQNNATMAADGPIYRINNLTIANGSTFITHTTGHTAIIGNITVDGTITSQASNRSNTILVGGTNPVISGSGTFAVPSLIVGNNSAVTLNMNVTALDTSVIIYGKMNFNNNQLIGNGKFNARVNTTVSSITGNLATDSFQIRNVVGNMIGILGLTVSGPGIAPGTTVVGYTTGGAMLALSKPMLAGGTAVALTFSSDTATLVTSHPNGFADGTGSVAMIDTKTYQDGINYIINGATASPFGISTGSTSTQAIAGFVEINAAVTTNRNLAVDQYLSLNNKLTLRPLDSVHILTGAVINGTFNSSNYIALGSTPAGAQSIVRYDGMNATTTLPIGTATYYLPISITPSGVSDYAVSTFEGITTNGFIDGTPLSPAQKQSVVNAVWQVNRIMGTGSADIQLSWNAALEGSTFTTLPDTDIGLITNNGSSWSLPTGTGNNTTNTVTSATSGAGIFSVGVVPPSQPFVFNPLPSKVYGNPDFNGGAISLNTTQPILYSSDNSAVATIVNNDIHITGAGTAIITATQASDGFYPAASATQTLTVTPAALTITADNKTKFETQANPTLTVTYSGFVLGETAAVLLTPPVISTTATTASGPGTYPITVNGATSNNYTISFVNGTLTVQAKQTQTITFNALPVKNYGNADFAAGATSTNNTIPITYTSSNTAVATIIGNNIHITGAGTTIIKASQAGNVGYFAAADVSRTLTVNKVNLTIRVRDTSRVVGQPNPPFTITYTGFVLGETASALLTPAVATTTATELSAPGFYPITLSGASSNNYNITLTNGRLTVLPLTGTTAMHMNAYMPNSSTITVRVYSPQPALGDVIIYDFNGKPLIRKNLFMPVGFISTNIPVPTLPNGIYIVTIKGDGVDLKQTMPVIR